MNGKTQASTPPVVSRSVEKRARSPTFINSVWQNHSNKLALEKIVAALASNPEASPQKKPRFLSPPAGNIAALTKRNQPKSFLETPKNMNHYNSCLRLSTASDRRPRININPKNKPPPMFIREKTQNKNDQKSNISKKQSQRQLGVSTSNFNLLVTAPKPRLSANFGSSSIRIKNYNDKPEKQDQTRSFNGFRKSANCSESANSVLTSKNSKESSTKKGTNQLFIPSAQSPKARSMNNFPHNSNIKVPKFIKEKQCAKSMRQSFASNKDSKNSMKSVNLGRLVGGQVESIQNSDHSGAEFKINIKPAVEKRSIDDFDLIKLLGQGSFGKAYLALQKALNFICVLKIVQKAKLNEYDANLLQRQIKIQSFLNHEHLTTLYGCFDDEDYIYLVMQLLPCGNLKDNMKNKTFSEKKISWMIKQISKGISYMHSHRLIHRDIKPQNIFTFVNYVKLGDFGCSVFNQFSRTSFVGSPCYLSPQQLKNDNYDQKVDMWQIGTLTYELLFKKCPFEKDILQMMNGRRDTSSLSELTFPAHIPVSPQAKDFLFRALNKNPYERMRIDQALNHNFLKLAGSDPKQINPF